MCWFRNIHVLRPARGLALMGLLLGLGATAAHADAPATRPDAQMPAKPAEHAVSTSPAPAPTATASPDPAGRSPLATSPPLTRAATRQRIEAMSPIGWLARYGDVQVGRTR